MSFPAEFIWGAASSAYQIEGAVNADGKGISVWDVLCERDGAVADGRSGDPACDHYHRYQDDVHLMRDLGLKAYRFSVSWPRVLPDGLGKANASGVDFYGRLVDELLACDIVPYLTLFHWDYPQVLHERGGWLHRDSADWFAEYTEVLVSRLSDRVANWITLNEPQVLVSNGYLEGVHAPGENLPLGDLLQIGHNLLRAHGKAVQVIRSSALSPPAVGFAPVGVVSVPDSNSPADVEAARKAMFGIVSDSPYSNTWWVDPIVHGRYPDDGLQRFGAAAPRIESGDMETICQPLDFLGTNIYIAERVRASESGAPERVPPPPGAPITAMDWPVIPEALYWGPKFLSEHYGLPIIVTENGVAVRDWIHLDGRVHDAGRIDFLQRYLRELHRAINDGADVRGYFHWSLTDNFEWACGYKQRFGLVHVDYTTQTRTLKDSAHWYKRVIATNGESLSGASTV